MFLNTFYELCRKNNTYPLTVVKETGIATGSITKWKNGTVPSGATLQKLADYFAVPVDYLLGRGNKRTRRLPQFHYLKAQSTIRCCGIALFLCCILCFATIFIFPQNSIMNCYETYFCNLLPRFVTIFLWLT